MNEDQGLLMGERAIVDVANLNYVPNSKIITKVVQNISNYLPSNYKTSLLDYWNKVLRSNFNDLLRLSIISSVKVIYH